MPANNQNTSPTALPKLDMQSPDLVDENLEKLAALFPNCVTEGPDGRVVDFDLLKQELNHAVIEGPKERYRLEWPGKKEAIVTANLPTTKTLRPAPEESVDFDNTENLYIEGDNLEVLKLLQESYLGKIKMIYIDPPYNTGKDFVYKDNFARDAQQELIASGQKDEYNQRLVVNPETSGRYHSDWLSMMYPRLKLARNLLKDDGVIFISIDDNEVHNLRKLCSEIFGEGNFISNIIWEKKYSPQNDAKWFSDNHDHILSYAKNKDMWRPNLLPRSEEQNARYTNRDNDPRGPWKSSDFSVKTYSANYDYPIETPSGKIVNPPKSRCWRTSKENFQKLVSENRIWFGENGDNVPSIKRFLSEVKDGIVPLTIWKYSEVGHNQDAAKEIRELFDGNGFFDTPKPVKLMERICFLGTERDSIVLDFFSGSGSLAQATMNLNTQDNGNRKFILAQIPELLEEKSDAYKEGYRMITDLGKERIRRAAKKIKEETGADIDYGFRVYKLDSSNMQDVYYKPQEYKQTALDLFADNIKPDRTPDDLLVQVMLDWGLPLSLKIERLTIAGKQVFRVAQNSLYACFDTGIDEAFAKAIAPDKPLRVVFRDSGFASDTAKINVQQLLKQLSPDTEMKVI